jgi:hypothetical protein
VDCFARNTRLDAAKCVRCEVDKQRCERGSRPRQEMAGPSPSTSGSFNTRIPSDTIFVNPSVGPSLSIPPATPFPLPSLISASRSEPLSTSSTSSTFRGTGLLMDQGSVPTPSLKRGLDAFESVGPSMKLVRTSMGSLRGGSALRITPRGFGETASTRPIVTRAEIATVLDRVSNLEDHIAQSYTEAMQRTSEIKRLCEDMMRNFADAEGGR